METENQTLIYGTVMEKHSSPYIYKEYSKTFLIAGNP
jgi:hypothetical protein